MLEYYKNTDQVKKYKELEQVMSLTKEVTKNGKEAIKLAIENGASKEIIEQAVAGAKFDAEAKKYIEIVFEAGSFAFPNTWSVKIYGNLEDGKTVYDVTFGDKSVADAILTGVGKGAKSGASKIGMDSDNASRLGDAVNKSTEEAKKHWDKVMSEEPSK